MFLELVSIIINCIFFSSSASSALMHLYIESVRFVGGLFFKILLRDTNYGIPISHFLSKGWSGVTYAKGRLKDASRLLS